jgi:hypothetical protein
MYCAVPNRRGTAAALNFFNNQATHHALPRHTLTVTQRRAPAPPSTSEGATPVADRKMRAIQRRAVSGALDGGLTTLQ